MKKRMIAMLLVASMLLSLNVPAFAADQRQTDFFTDRQHADVNFEDMLPADVDPEDYLAQTDEVRALLDDAANTDEVTAAFEDLANLYRRMLTALELVYISHAQDASDEVAAAKLEQLSENEAIITDGLSLLIRDILLSECSSALDGILTEADKESYRTYEAMSDRALELDREITATVNKYYSEHNKVYTASYNGKSYTEQELIAALQEEKIDGATYTELSNSIQLQRNKVLGDIYIEIVALYKEYASELGYSSFANYAYKYAFGRDYTPADLNGYREALKTYIAPLIQPTYSNYQSVSNAEILSKDYSGDVALDAIAPYVDQISSEMTEAFDYMREHGLYDTVYSNEKMAAGFTTILPEYNAPFFFNDATLSFHDLLTAIHEFGHYNNFYYSDSGWDGLHMSDYDSAEVHSQGFELLMMHYFPEMVGEKDALALETYQMLSMTYILALGGVFDELQLYAFAEDDLTLDKLNQKYTELLRAYGIASENFDGEAYDWVEVPHSYENPFYYISYSISAAGALGIWQEAQEDYFEGVDKYLTFSALDNDVSLQDGFAQLGLMSPISSEFIKSLSESLKAENEDLAARIAVLYPVVGNFTDVPGNAWYTEDVATVYDRQLMSGMSDTIFAPNGQVNRAMAAAILYRLEESPELSDAVSFTDVSADSWYYSAVNWGENEGIVAGYPDNTYKPAKDVTREELVSLLYRYAQAVGVDTSVGEDTNILSYEDATSVQSYAIPAMQWACGEGIIQGDNGKLMPQKGATRAELAAITVRFLNLMEEDEVA